jgi:hypothetical protein
MIFKRTPKESHIYSIYINKYQPDSSGVACLTQNTEQEQTNSINSSINQKISTIPTGH